MASAAEVFAATSRWVGRAPVSTATANVFSAITVDIPHYANAANNKAALSKSAVRRGVTTGLDFTSRGAHFWRSNASITQITIIPTSTNWLAGSRVSLYGYP